MHTPRNRCWFALAVAFGLATSAARGDDYSQFHSQSARRCWIGQRHPCLRQQSRELSVHGVGIGLRQQLDRDHEFEWRPGVGARWCHRQSGCSHIRRPTREFPRRGNQLFQFVVWSISQLVRDTEPDNGFLVNRRNGWEPWFSLAGGFRTKRSATEYRACCAERSRFKR